MMYNKRNPGPIYFFRNLGGKSATGLASVPGFVRQIVELDILAAQPKPGLIG